MIFTLTLRHFSAKVLLYKLSAKLFLSYFCGNIFFLPLITKLSRLYKLRKEAKNIHPSLQKPKEII